MQPRGIRRWLIRNNHVHSFILALPPQSPFSLSLMIMPVPASAKRLHPSSYPDDDPLDQVLRPPPDESHDQREIRLAREEEARKVSQAIDATIKAERQARRKKRIVRLLLLGQSESGQSIQLAPHFSLTSLL